MRTFWSVAFYGVSALWTFAMWYVVAISQRVEHDAYASVFSFGILFVLGLLWIPVALTVAAVNAGMPDNKLARAGKLRSVLIPLGHCVYFGALLVVPLMAESVGIKLTDESFAGKTAMMSAVYLLLLGLAYCYQAYDLCRPKLALIKGDGEHPPN